MENNSLNNTAILDDQKNNSGNKYQSVLEKNRLNYPKILILIMLILSLISLIITVIFVLNLKKIQEEKFILSGKPLKITPTLTKTPQKNIPTITSMINLKLEDFIDKEFLGENNNYSVYLIKSKSEDDLNKIGELIIYDKKKMMVTKIEGTFSIFGATIVIDDEKGKYVLLSTGTSMSRRVIPISLTKKALAGKEFCATSDFLFYKDYVIYGNCDTFQNRPWEAGQAPSLVVLNLLTGEEKLIAKSDLFHQYRAVKILDDTLYYVDAFVTKEEDWQNSDTQKTINKTYDLSSL